MISGNDVNHFLGSLAVVMLGWIIKGVVSINSHLSQLNGSVGMLKEWARIMKSRTMSGITTSCRRFTIGGIDG